MRGLLYTFRLGGSLTKIIPDRTEMVNGSVHLKKLKEGVGGGLIQIIPYFDTIEIDNKVTPCIAFCDEEGKINGLAVNRRATLLWEYALQRKGRTLIKDDGEFAGYLVGSIIVVCGDDDFMRAL